MSEEMEPYFARDYIFDDWKINHNFSAEVYFSEKYGLKSCIVIENMTVIAKLVFVGDVIKVKLLEGYTVQIAYQDKIISVLSDE